MLKLITIAVAFYHEMKEIDRQLFLDVFYGRLDRKIMYKPTKPPRRPKKRKRTLG